MRDAISTTVHLNNAPGVPRVHGKRDPFAIVPVGGTRWPVDLSLSITDPEVARAWAQALLTTADDLTVAITAAQAVRAADAEKAAAALSAITPEEV